MKATKKLIGAVVALIAALAVSVGATFAWFTTSNTAKVNSFELKVQDATGSLYIGKSATTLGLSPIDLTTEAAAVTLKDVTTTDKGKTFKKKGGSDPAEANSYFTVELWVKSDDAVGLYLHTGTTMTCTADTSNDLVISDTKIHSAIETKYGDTITDGKIAATADNAARVSIMVEGSDPVIWEPGSEQGYKTGNLAADYETYLSNPTEWPSAGAAESTVKGDLTLNTQTDKGAADGTKIGDLSAGVATKITISIWLEGTDGDCLNSILKDKISTALVFAGVAAEE